MIRGLRHRYAITQIDWLTDKCYPFKTGAFLNKNVTYWTQIGILTLFILATSLAKCSHIQPVIEKLKDLRYGDFWKQQTAANVNVKQEDYHKQIITFAGTRFWEGIILSNVINH